MKKIRAIFIVCIVVIASILTPNAYAFQKVGYTTSNITKPDDLLISKQDVLNAINYNLAQLNDEFVLDIENFERSLLPKSKNELEMCFVEKIRYSEKQKDNSEIFSVRMRVDYNASGRAVKGMLSGKDIKSLDDDAKKIIQAVNPILDAIKGKSDYEKIVYIHDEVVRMADYEEYDTPSPAYAALVNGECNHEGYAEALHMLFMLSGIESRIVVGYFATDYKTEHHLNMVNLEGDWFIVDAAVDDPITIPSAQSGKGGNEINHDYLLVSQRVANQRYVWEDERYPLCSTENNWHHRNNLVAANQNELQDLVKKKIEDKETFISIWVDDYTTEKYAVNFINDIGGIKSYQAKITPAISSEYMNKPISTALRFYIEYE